MPSHLSRRGFLAGSASFVAVLAALQARRAGSGPGPRESRFVPGPYGPLRPVADLETGLPLIYLPEGFEYRTYSWTGDVMSDGSPAPDSHDGMGVDRGERPAARISRSRWCAITSAAFASPILAPARYDAATPTGQAFAPAGGTTTLTFRGRRWVSARPSLGGTIYNCAGGATPWGTWLTCEETVIDLTARGGRRHGYVFEVRADPAGTTAKPIVGMGRMLHEAVAIDPATGIAYLTEDEAWNSGFYRYVANSPRVGAGQLRSGRPAAGGARRRPQSRGPARARGRRRPSHRVGGHRKPGCRPGQDAGRDLRPSRARERAVPAGLGPGRARDEPRRGHLPSRRPAVSRRHRGGPGCRGPARAWRRRGVGVRPA